MSIVKISICILSFLVGALLYFFMTEIETDELSWGMLAAYALIFFIVKEIYNVRLKEIFFDHTYNAIGLALLIFGVTFGVLLISSACVFMASMADPKAPEWLVQGLYIVAPANIAGFLAVSLVMVAEFIMVDSTDATV